MANIFKRGYDFIKDLFDSDDSGQEIEKSQVANSTPSGFFSEKEKNNEMVFTVGEGLEEADGDAHKRIQDIIAKSPERQQPSNLQKVSSAFGDFERKREEFLEPSPDGVRARDIFREVRSLFETREEDIEKQVVKGKDGRDITLETTKFGELVQRNPNTGKITTVDPFAAAGSFKNVAREGIEKLSKEFASRVKNIKLPKRLIKFGEKTSDVFDDIAKSDNMEEIFSFIKPIFKDRSESDVIRIADDLTNTKSTKKVEEYIQQIDNIEPSVVQVVDTKTGDVTFQTIPKGQLQQFHSLIDDTTQGIAGKEIDGKIYHITAKTPGKMTERGAKFTGMANPETIPTIGENVKEKVFNINLNKLDMPPKQKQKFTARVEGIKPELEAIRGNKLTNKEVMEAAQESELLSKAVTRDETKQATASLQKTRQKMLDLDNMIDQTSDLEQKAALINEQLELAKIVSAEAADAGRKLQSFNITATAGEESVRQRVLKRITKMADDTNDLAKKAAEVDFNNANEVNKFYREFVKPTAKELIDEFRYNNMLANPRTQARNIMSNLLQATVVRPTTKFVDAGIQTFTSKLTGKQQDAFFKEMPAYYRSAIGAIPEAFDDFVDVWKGAKFNSNQDLADIGGGAMSSFLNKTLKVPEKVADKVGAAFNIPTKSLESVDRFLMKVMAEGEKAAQLKKGVSEEFAQKEANRVAQNSLFRSGIDPKNKTGQGKLLSALDGAIGAVDNLRDKVPGLSWFVPFVKTPANFAKQWIEYSPAGLFTLPGSMRKKEQLAKAVVGSSITAMGAQMAMDDRTTWGVPTDGKAKELFFASGKKPYSVKIGDKWVPMMYLGPWAFALALPAAFKYHSSESPKALTDSQMAKMGKSVSSMAEFLSSQTFMEGLGNFVDVFKGDPDASVEKSLAFTAGQTIPWSGLVRYISTIVDPVYRKSDSFSEAIQKDLPFLSQKLEPYRLPTGEESTRNMSSYLAPYDITQEKKEFDDLLQLRNEQLQTSNFLKRNDEKLNDKALSIIDRMNEAKTQEEGNKIAEELSGNKELKNTVINVMKKRAINTVATIQPLFMFKDNPKAIAEIVYGRILQATTEEEMQDNVTEFIEDLKENGLWSDSVMRNLQAVIEKDQTKATIQTEELEQEEEIEE